MIDKPGVYDLADDDYFADPAPVPSMSASVAARITSATPFHAAAEHPRLAPRAPNDEPDDGGKFDLGKAFHAALTGKGAIVVVEAGDYRSKAAQADRDTAREAGATPLLAAQWRRVERMLDSFRAQLIGDPEIGRDPFAEPAQNELSMLWTDRGVWCRAKPDALDYRNRIVWDAKTTAGLADPDGWTATQLRATSIDLRAAHYLHGASRLLGAGWRYVFAVVETAWPHAASVVELPASVVAVGEDRRRNAVMLWGRCVAEDRWPAWPRGFNRPEGPAYHEARWLERRDGPTQAAIDLAMEMQRPGRA